MRFFIFFFILLAVASEAQVLTHKHKARLETVTDSARRAILLKRYFKKDSVKYRRKKAQLEQKLKGVLKDSISALPGFQPMQEVTALDSSKAGKAIKNARQKSADRLKRELPGELSDFPMDSAQLKSIVLSEGKKVIHNELELEIPNAPLDSLNKESIAKSLEQQTEKKWKKELEDPEAPNGLFSTEQAELVSLKQQSDLDQAQRQMKSKMTNHAKQFIARHAEKIQQVQGKMGDLKRKYSYVPNSNDLSTAKKRTSLRDEAFKKRLTFGGNVNISRTNPVQLDLSPTVGYRINTLFELGGTVMYRSQLEADKRGVNTDDERTYGYSVYVRHMAFKNFFGYIEGENISREVVVQDQSERQWTQNLLLGLGREFTISKWLQFQTIITYNFLHENRDGVYGSPVVFKTGVRFGK
ncbi:MAG: hypothetical protein AAGF85_15290 [Bacteroidota bacterium]